MRGHPDLNFPAFHKAAILLREQGYEVFNPAESKVPQDDIRACLAMDLDYLCREAEAIAMILGWSQSRGAIAELGTAKALDLWEIYLPDCQPIPSSESPFLLEPRLSITSHSRSQRSPKSRWRVRNSTELKGGTDPSQLMKPTPSFGIFSTVVLLTTMVSVILAKWLGEH